MRSFGSEVLFTIPALALPLVMVFAFPRAALDFHAVNGRATEPRNVAFIHISAKAEEEAVKAAKTVWKVGDTPMMAIGTLPEEQFQPILDITERIVAREDTVDEYGRAPYLPSLAAPSFKNLKVEPEAKVAPTFSREEMLKLD